MSGALGVVSHVSREPSLSLQLMLVPRFADYGHVHQDGDQGEWWSAWQSTLLPIIVYVWMYRCTASPMCRCTDVPIFPGVLCVL